MKELIIDSILTDCFSQNKDEFIVQFELKNGEQFNIIAHLDPQFTCLSFPEEYHKAKRNIAPIFTNLQGEKVTGIKGYLNERAFKIEFSSNKALLLKLFGHQSNALLLHNDKVIDIFKSNLKADYNVDPKTLDRPIDQSKNAIIESIPNISSIYPTLDKRTKRQIEATLVNLKVNKAYEYLKKIITQLEEPNKFYIIENEEHFKFSLLPVEGAIFSSDSPLIALTKFFRLFIKKYKYQSEQQTLLKELNRKLNKTESYIRKTKEKKDKLAKNTSYKEIADILMANLHQIEAHSSTIELHNFYTDKPIKIKLNHKLSAQNNAEKYYNKAKNLTLEIKNLNDIISSKEHLATTIRSEIKKVLESASVRELQKLAPGKNKKSEKAVLPFKHFIIDGFTILVGKNAKNNDLLTLKFAKKNDLFFHAKDVSGSHVILKEMSGKRFPKKVLETTAAIAAYYSKRKTDTLCPVGYTEKKFVRKPKGSAPGLVIVEREKVLLVRPQLPANTTQRG